MNKDTVITLAVIAAVVGVAYLVLKPAISEQAQRAAGLTTDVADSSTSWLRGLVKKLGGGSGTDPGDYSDAALSGYNAPAAPAGSTVGQGPDFTGWWG